MALTWPRVQRCRECAFSTLIDAHEKSVRIAIWCDMWAWWVSWEDDAPACWILLQRDLHDAVERYPEHPQRLSLSQRLRRRWDALPKPLPW